jgi:hypothetical protein
MKSRDRKWRHTRKYCLHMSGRAFPRFFLTIAVVRNVQLCMTGSSMANGCDMNGSHVTRSDVIFPALFSYCTISFILLLGYLVEIPQWERRRHRKHPWSTTQHLEQIRTHHKGNHSLSVLWRHFLWRHVKSGSHTTSGQFEVLCSTPRVFSMTSAFSLWYFY